MLRIRELDAGNVTGKNHAGFRGGHESPAIAAIRAVIQGAPGSARPNFKSTCRHGTEYGAGTATQLRLSDSSPEIYPDQPCRGR